LQEALEYSLSLTRFSLKLPSGSLTCRERKKRERERERERYCNHNHKTQNQMERVIIQWITEMNTLLLLKCISKLFSSRRHKLRAAFSCVCVRVWVWVYVCMYVWGGACSSNQRHHCFHFSRAPLPFPSRARVGEGM